MGAIGGPLGLSGGAGGSGYAKPEFAQLPASFQPSMQQQQDLLNALSTQGGIQNQNQVYGQLQGIINGTGPNAAQAQLNQNTAANVAQTGALMAGQRGGAQNIGLLARQAGQAGMQAQQAGVGQAATLQAQQQQNAINAAGNIANTQVGNQIGQTNAIQNANQALYGTNVAMQSNVNQGNTALVNQNMQMGESALGGGANGAGSAIGSMFAGGGQVDGQAFNNGPQSEFGQYLQSMNGGNKGNAPMASKGGMVDVVVSPGEKLVPPNKVEKAAGGKVEAKTVPGKARVPGDNLKNDTVKTKLPEGTVVIPRTKAKDEKKSSNFVAAQLAKRRGKK